MVRKSEEAADELDSLSPYPDYSPPLYSAAEDEEDTPAGPSDPLVPQTFKLGKDAEEACVVQKWQPGFLYDGHGIFTDAKKPYLIGTTNARYSEDEESLCQLMIEQAAHIPRIALIVKGTHEVYRKKGDDSPQTGILFDLKVDITRLFCRPTDDPSKPWHSIYTPPPHVVAFRGGATCHTATTELDAAPDLKTWCHRYVSQVKNSMFPQMFTLIRQPCVWNRDPNVNVQKSLEEAIRRINYAGSLNVCLKIEDFKFTVFSPHWMNRARQNNWIWWTFVLLQLWIITWPILAFCTKRFEVVTVEWPMKREVDGQTVYAKCNEEEWLETWGEAVVNLAYMEQFGWVHETMAEKYGKLRRAYEGLGNGQDSNDVTAMVGYVNAKTGLRIAPNGRGEWVAAWGQDNKVS